MDEDSGAIEAQDRHLLAECEAVMERTAEAAEEWFQAIAAIKAQELWLHDYKSWADYLVRRWDVSESTGKRWLVQAKAIEAGAHKTAGRTAPRPPKARPTVTPAAVAGVPSQRSLAPKRPRPTPLPAVPASAPAAVVGRAEPELGGQVTQEKVRHAIALVTSWGPDVLARCCTTEAIRDAANVLSRTLTLQSPWDPDRKVGRKVPTSTPRTFRPYPKAEQARPFGKK